VDLMESEIILYQGKYVFKETDYGNKVLASTAFLTDSSVGVAVVTKPADFFMSVPEPNNSSVLSAIRGALFAEEMKEMTPDLLYSCLCMGLINPSAEQKSKADSLKSYLTNKRIRDLKQVVPSDIENILFNLIKINIPFNESEILHEINLGKIKKSENLDYIIKENECLKENLDDIEYGVKVEVSELRDIMNLDLTEHICIVPFFDTYMDKVNKKTMKAIAYGTTNAEGFLILSKLKDSKNIDFNLNIQLKSY
jgi:hypothetical protein